MRWLQYFLKCVLGGFLAMQIYFVIQIGLWTVLDPSSTAFQRAERWRLCGLHWSCPVHSSWVSYDQISANVKRAVLVSEDDIFFQHMGIRIEDIQKAWNLLSAHNSDLMLENEQLKKQLMRRSLWYSIKRAIRIWRGKE
jgi:monofunctional biosynthetic peptidoglycan transglycosylase